MQSWIPMELADTDLPDKRHHDRFAIILDRLSSHPERSIPASCNGWAETQGTYRFLDNDRFDHHDLHRPHYCATLKRCRPYSKLYVPQDTTLLDLTRPEEKLGGPLDDVKHWGFLAHVALAITPDGVVQGVLHSQLWARDPEHFPLKTKGKKARNRPIEQKESRRWLDGYQVACEVAAALPQTQVICLADSEGDVYEFFSAWHEQQGTPADWIVRACQDRKSSVGLLWGAVSASPVLGCGTVEVSKQAAQSHDGRKRKSARSQRLARVLVQSRTLTLKAPWRADRELPDLTVNAVLVREELPPAGEPAVEWLLLTSLPVGSFEAALEVANGYSLRWPIETYFGVLKGGCKIEESQLETQERFEKCLLIYEIVAWRVLWCLRMGRECPEMPCEIGFDEPEWRALLDFQEGPGPSSMPSLGEMIVRVARLGGYLGRARDEPPGPKVMWIGLQRLSDITGGWLAAKAVRLPKDDISV